MLKSHFKYDSIKKFEKYKKVLINGILRTIEALAMFATTGYAGATPDSITWLDISKIFLNISKLLYGWYKFTIKLSLTKSRFSPLKLAIKIIRLERRLIKYIQIKMDKEEVLCIFCYPLIKSKKKKEEVSFMRYHNITLP